MNNENRYYVYVHKLESNGEIFYVGKGTNRRAYDKVDRSESWLIKANQGYTIEILKEGLNSKEAIDLEIEYYDKYTKTLVNRGRPTHFKTINHIKMSQLFDVNPDSPSGLSWKIDVPFINRQVYRFRGQKAGRITGGYWVLKLENLHYGNHRIIYAIHNKVDVAGDLVVDHIDGVKTNNCPTNLRLVSIAGNTRNRLNNRKKIYGDTNFVGVIRYKYRGYDYYVAQWKTIEGKARSKSFNIATHGETEAFRLACEWRKEQLRLLNEQGAGYTDRHGT